MTVEELMVKLAEYPKNASVVNVVRSTVKYTTEINEVSYHTNFNEVELEQ